MSLETDRVTLKDTGMDPEIRAKVEREMLEYAEIGKKRGENKTNYQRRKEAGIHHKTVRIKPDPEWDIRRKRILEKYGVKPRNQQ